MKKVYQQVEQGKRITDKNTPITIQTYDKMIQHFEDSEEYEKCRVVLTEKNKVLNHNSNYLSK